MLHTVLEQYLNFSTHLIPERLITSVHRVCSESQSAEQDDGYEQLETLKEGVAAGEAHACAHDKKACPVH